VSVGVYIYLCVFFDDARPSGPIHASSGWGSTTPTPHTRAARPVHSADRQCGGFVVFPVRVIFFRGMMICSDAKSTRALPFWNTGRSPQPRPPRPQPLSQRIPESLPLLLLLLQAASRAIHVRDRIVSVCKFLRSTERVCPSLVRYHIPQ
jgi:hypothetical protein